MSLLPPDDELPASLQGLTTEERAHLEGIVRDHPDLFTEWTTLSKGRLVVALQEERERRAPRAFKTKARPEGEEPRVRLEGRSEERLAERWEGEGPVEVTTAAGFDAHDGALVRVVGTLVRVDVRMARRPPALYQGHVAVELDGDGAQVALFPIPAARARRPLAEVERFERKRVAAVGVACADTPPGGPPGAASPMGYRSLAQVHALYEAPSGSR